MADQEEVDQTAFPPRVARWEADGYDALRVVVDELKAENARLTHERDTLKEDFDSFVEHHRATEESLTSSKEENARLKGLCLSAIDALESEGFYHTGKTFRDELEAQGAETG